MASIFSRESLLRYAVALGGFAVVIYFFSPSWAAFSLWSRVPELSGMLEVRRGATVLEQVAHPGAELSDPLHRAIQWRLLFPLLGHYLTLPPTILFGLADLGCVIVLGYIASLLRGRGAGWTTTFLSVVALGAASWIFVSTGWLGYYDSWLAFALLLVAFARRPWAVWLACVWAPWVDERFVLALPIALLCRWLSAPTEKASVSAAPFSWKRELGIPAALVAAYLVVRLGVLAGESAANATLGGYFAGKNYLDAPLGRIVLGIWEGLRGGWVFVVAAVLLLRSQPARAAALGVAVVLTIAVGLATAQDYSRSMTMLLPVAVLGALALASPAPGAPRKLLGFTVAAALLLPAHHVMNDLVNPIYYLPHELAAFDSPPPAAMPELRELSAIHAMEAGDYAAAERDLTIAIKLAPGDPSAAKQRGILYASARRWDDAKRDFTLVTENDPQNPDGWFLRAQVELAQRDLDAARADFDHARSVAGPGWAERPDVKRVAAAFAQLNGKQ